MKKLTCQRKWCMAERVPLKSGKKLICPACRMPHLKADLRENSKPLKRVAEAR
jgi:hypothetical protein